MTLPAPELLAVVEASPACVARHDKQAWLALFADGAIVEDPVGSAPHRRGARVRGTPPDDELGRFWETFIAPNEIRFEVREDIVAGLEVVRDVIIHTRLSTGLEIRVPAHLLYELVEEGGSPRIRRLAAHWELPRLSGQALRSGWRGCATMVRLGGRMLRCQGLGGTLGYARGMVLGIGSRGRETVEALAAAVTARDEAVLRALFVAQDAFVEQPPGGRVPPVDWLRALPAGSRLEASDVAAAGWTASFRFVLGRAAGETSGIAFLAFDPPSRRLVSARFFVADRRPAEPEGAGLVDAGLPRR
jgi:hypothetical protein